MTLWLPAGEVGAVRRDRDDAGAIGGRALFVDRDGVVIEDAHYLHDPDGVRLIPGAAAALRRARGAGWLVIGVSNQSALGRGLSTEQEFTAVQRRVDADLAAEGARLDALFYCPHAPEEGCRCRKPGSGLLDEAAALFAWRPDRSWLVGDKRSDMELALLAGLSACLVRTGEGAAQAAGLPPNAPILVADDLADAVTRILAGERP